MADRGWATLGAAWFLAAVFASRPVGAAAVDVVEFYNAGLDHYFITWVPDEIGKLDQGVFKGWARTGLSFNVFDAAQSGTSAVCRIYIPPGKGDGHYFGRDQVECDGTMAKNPTFILESPSFFYLYPPSLGNCAAGTTPVYRVFSNRADANHRYTTDRTVRDQMVAKGWLAEGDGADLVVMCAPAIAASTTYVRSSSIAYVPQQVAGGTLPGVQVVVESKSLVSGATGSFDYVLPSPMARDFVSIEAAKPGYMNLWTELFPDDSPTGIVNLGLYPETPAVVPRPGFVKGIFTMDVGGFMAATYDGGYFEPTYDRISQQTGANLVANSDPVWVESYDVASATVKMTKTSSIPMLTRDQYTRIVGAAHGRNLEFMMLLGVYPVGSLPLPWSVDVSNSVFWDAWFAAYQPIVIEYADIARDLGIEYVSLGMNAGFMSKLPVAHWQKLIAAIRAEGYKGKLVYQGMASPDLPYWEGLAFNNGCCPPRESAQLEFAKVWDAVVIDVYNIALGKTAPLPLSRDEMKAGFRWLLDQTKNYPAPLMFMVGTPSVHGGAVVSEYIEPCLVCNSVAPARQRDLMQQADVYQALFEVISSTPTSGMGKVAGVLSWGYWFTDDPLRWTEPTHTFPMAYDKSASIRGKPAEAVVRWWFDRL